MLSSTSKTPAVSHMVRLALGLMTVQIGNGADARERYVGLEAQRGTMLASQMVCIDRVLGLLARTMGQLEKATSDFEDALTFCSKAGYRPQLAWTCHDFAETLLARNHSGDNQRAMSLLDNAVGISTELGMRPLMERVTALQDRAESASGETPAHPDGLTEREIEVLHLVAAAHSNREIGDRLFISPHTVANHVRNILAKTGTANRIEAATYAIRHKLT